MDDSLSPSYDPVERERMASMLENWFQQRIAMSNKALKLILIPLIAVVASAVAFWFNYYIPVPGYVIAALFAIFLLAWVVCLFIGVSIIKKVRTGDSIMLRKIRSSNKQQEA